MKIEKVNNFWVPSNDIHIEDWRSGKPFTQNKCLNKFLDYCESQNIKMKSGIQLKSRIFIFCSRANLLGAPWGFPLFIPYSLRGARHF